MSGPLNQAQAVAVQIERIHKSLRPLYEQGSKTWQLLGKKQEPMSGRDMRVPLNIAPPGNFRMVDMDGGDLGRGGGSQYVYGTFGPKAFAVALEATKKAEYSSNTSEKAISDVVKKDMIAGAKRMARAMDALMQTPGTGQLSVLTSGSATTTWVTGGDFNTVLLDRGMRVELYDSTFATKRTGVATIQRILTNGSIVVDAIPVGATDGDLIVHEGMSGSNPVSLNGIPVFQNDATTGTLLGLTRADYPELQTPSVDAGSSLLTWQMVRAAHNKLLLKRDDDSILASLKTHISPVQIDAWEQLAQLVMEIAKTESSKQGFSPFFAPKDMLGAPIVRNTKANPKRIDFIVTDRWFRGVSADIQPYKDPGDGRTVFGIYGASGGRAAASVWYVFVDHQMCSDDPGAGAYIKSLAKPPAYN